MALGRRDQERAELLRTHEVHVPYDFVRRKWLVPINPRKGVASPSGLPGLSGGGRGAITDAYQESKCNY